MKFNHLLCALALTAPLTANADFLSVSAGGGGWNETPSGNLQTTSGIDDNVDVIDQLLWEKESQSYLFITFEHFVPLVPNVRLMHTKLGHTGDGIIDQSFTFGGQTFTASADVISDVSIETTDIYAYYEILDNVVSLDIGLNIRNVKVDYLVSSVTAGSSSSDSVSATIPMLYALVGASPWPGVILSGELSYISLAGNSITDVSAKIAYTTNFLVGFEAGVRNQSYTLDDVSGTNAKFDFSGPFVGAYLKF